MYWIKKSITRIYNSIAFYPAFISLCCILVAVLVFQFDISEYGANLKNDIKWLAVADSDTARTIIAAVAGGMISLTVFSFSMVMIVLTRAAAQMSNRILDNLIQNRFQQITLGLYIGTIIYAFFLLSLIRDGESFTQIPGISILLLTILTVVDIFFFIYFLHYVTQAVKYEQIIKRIFERTKNSLETACLSLEQSKPIALPNESVPIKAKKSGVYEGVNLVTVTECLKGENCSLYLTKPRGVFVLKGQEVGYIDKFMSASLMSRVEGLIDLNTEESIENNFNFGFQQLTEIAIKALSPGINDPGTAIISLRSITILLSYRLLHFPKNEIIIDDKSSIFQNNRSIDEIINQTIIPMFDYGKNDRLFLNALVGAMQQLNNVAYRPIFSEITDMVEERLDNL